MHKEPHPLAGQRVRINLAAPRGRPANDRLFVELRDEEFVVEDWWDHLTGRSWGDSDNNPACLKYAMRTGFSQGIPLFDNEVVYGHVVSTKLGHLLHQSELGDVIEKEEE